MRRTSASVGFLVLAVTVRAATAADGPPPDAVKAELEKFQGAWTLLAAETEGVRTPAEKVPPAVVTITGNRHTIKIGGEELAGHDVTFEIDPTTTPPQVTDTVHAGPLKDKQIRGIYRLAGDTLVSCVAAPGSPDRPKTFETKPGSGQTLRVFRRVKDAPAASREAIEAELRRFQGTWKTVSLVWDGRPLTDAPGGSQRLVIKGDRFSAEERGRALPGVFTIDPTARPKTIDITILAGPAVGMTHSGVYELEGDTYRVCMPTRGGDRPAAIASTAEGHTAVHVLEREKP